MTFRKTVAASTAALCLASSIQLPTAAAATVTQEYGTCSVKLSTAEDKYLEMHDSIEPLDLDPEFWINSLKDSVKTIKVLLANDKTRAETRAFLDALADPTATDMGKESEKLYEKLPDNLFSKENDPTGAFADHYSGWKTYARNQLNSYAIVVLMVSANTAEAELIKSGDTAGLAAFHSAEKAHWNELTAGYHDMDYFKGNSKFAKDIIAACEDLKTNNKDSATVSVEYSFDQFIQDTIKVGRDNLPDNYELAAAVKAGEAELKTTVADNITSAITGETDNRAKNDENKSGFNWKIILIVVGILLAVGAAAATMMPKPPVA